MISFFGLYSNFLVGMDETDLYSQTMSRRAVLSTLSVGAVVGLAGCSNNQSGSSDGGNDGGDSEGNGGEGEAHGTDGATGGNGGNTPNSTIPGEVVHNGLNGIEVVDHWYDGEFLHIRIRNERSEPLQEAESWLKGGDIIVGRGLSEDGESLRQTTWTGVDSRPGPSSIDPNSEATVGFPIAMGGDPARYEICLANKSYGSSSWSELCS